MSFKNLKYLFDKFLQIRISTGLIAVIKIQFFYQICKHISSNLVSKNDDRLKLRLHLDANSDLFILWNLNHTISSFLY